jgi:allantoin racemase
MPRNKMCFLSWGPGSKERVDLLNSIAGKDYHWDFYYGKKTNESSNNLSATKSVALESLYDEAFSIPYLAIIAKEAEEEGYEAIVISCGGDIGLEVIREAVSIPVIGPATTALHICSLLGTRISQLTIGKPFGVEKILPWDVPPYRSSNIGLTKWISVRRIGMEIREISNNPTKSYEQMFRASEAAIKEENVDVITFGCGSMAWLMNDEELSINLGIPVVNFIKTAVKMAEMYVSLGLTHSKLTYPYPKLFRDRKHIGIVE